MAHEWAGVAVGAVLGCYLRILLVDATPIGFPSYLSSQFVGSFVFGCVLVEKPRYLSLLGPSFAACLLVGFCGSLTTFSTWQVDVASSTVNFASLSGPNSFSAGEGSYAWFSELLIGVAVPMCGLLSGRHLGAFLFASWGLDLIRTDHDVYRGRTMVVIDVLFCIAVVGVVLGAGLAPGRIAFALLFAPVGACLRFGFSKSLNGKRFPSGTFVANLLGSIIGCVLLVVLSFVHLSSHSCDALQAISLGFCGSLTTVSSFVAELYDLGSSGYWYGTLSVLTTQVFLLAILGGVVASGVTPEKVTCANSGNYSAVVSH